VSVLRGEASAPGDFRGRIARKPATHVQKIIETAARDASAGGAAAGFLCFLALNGLKEGDDGVDTFLRGFVREPVALRLENIRPTPAFHDRRASRRLALR
jgi:hypothetical protein